MVCRMTHTIILIDDTNGGRINGFHGRLPATFWLHHREPRLRWSRVCSTVLVEGRRLHLGNGGVLCCRPFAVFPFPSFKDEIWLTQLSCYGMEHVEFGSVTVPSSMVDLA